MQFNYTNHQRRHCSDKWFQGSFHMHDYTLVLIPPLCFHSQILENFIPFTKISAAPSPCPLFKLLTHPTPSPILLVLVYEISNHSYNQSSGKMYLCLSDNGWNLRKKELRLTGVKEENSVPSSPYSHLESLLNPGQSQRQSQFVKHPLSISTKPDFEQWFLLHSPQIAEEESDINSLCHTACQTLGDAAFKNED